MQTISDIQLDFSDVLIVPQATSINHRAEVNIIRKFKKLDLEACPIMSANMTQTGTFEVAKNLVSENMIGALHKFYSSKELNDFFEKNGSSNLYFVTIGLRNTEKEIEKIKEISNNKFSILIDVPNAYIPAVENLVKECRKIFKDRIIAVGNVCTGDRTQELIKCGANFVKVGIGPSQVCQTRFVTGVGRPQLSAIIECANAAHQVGGYIIADGGFKTTGDFCKAFVAGADICMSGSMFAGCTEASGEIIEKIVQTNECIYDQETSKCLGLLEIKNKYKNYYGMSSFRAQRENYGKITQSGTSEGVENKLIPYTGDIINTINHIEGALRSCGSYIGAKEIKHFSRQGIFYKVNRLQ